MAKKLNDFEQIFSALRLKTMVWYLKKEESCIKSHLKKRQAIEVTKDN